MTTERAKTQGAKPSESATIRLSRLLTMVPWLLNRQGVEIQEAAREFDVTPAQVEADLALLFLCGTPGGYHGDLIEAEWESGRVFLGNADTINRPLRLGVNEALTLIVGLRALAAVPGIGERDAVVRALAKLEAATGSASAGTSRIQVLIDEGASAQTLSVAQQALADHRRVHLRYLVPGRDESTERDVDPMRLINFDAQWYLEGWCHRAEGVRLFRLDRIEALSVLDEDGAPPAAAEPRDLDAGVFTPGAKDQLVKLELGPGAVWVSDYYPTESVEPTSGGGAVVTLRTADTAWLRRLMWRLGSQATVLEPAELAREVRRGARAALEAYEGSTPASGPTGPTPSSR
ncbi:MAG: proteasome accessory factor [Actinomycetota bacterium]|jgi:proteasome accessory factor C|nr:proteasome accessory factor [Actinomycetota bacterium]